MNILPKDPVVHSFYIASLGKQDMDKIKRLKQVLDKKLLSGDNSVDIKKLAEYCNETELIARQYITYLESQVYYQKKFIITNGAKEYEKIDSIRTAAIQERSVSENK